MQHERERQKKLAEAKEMYYSKSTKELVFKPDTTKSKRGAKAARQESSSSDEEQPRRLEEFLRDQDRFRTRVKKKIEVAQLTQEQHEKEFLKREFAGAKSRKILEHAQNVSNRTKKNQVVVDGSALSPAMGKAQTAEAIPRRAEKAAEVVKYARRGREKSPEAPRRRVALPAEEPVSPDRFEDTSEHLTTNIVLTLHQPEPAPSGLLAPSLSAAQLGTLRSQFGNLQPPKEQKGKELNASMSANSIASHYSTPQVIGINGILRKESTQGSFQHSRKPSQFAGAINLKAKPSSKKKDKPKKVTVKSSSEKAGPAETAGGQPVIHFRSDYPLRRDTIKQKLAEEDEERPKKQSLAKRTEKIILQKFNQEFNAALQRAVGSIRIPLMINSYVFTSLIEDLGLASKEAMENDHSDDFQAVEEVWTLLREARSGTVEDAMAEPLVCVADAKLYLLAILGIRGNKRTGLKAPPKQPNTVLAYGWLNDNNDLCFAARDEQLLKSRFQVLHTNHLHHKQ